MKVGNENQIVTREKFERQRNNVGQKIKVWTQETGLRTIDKRVVLAIGGLATAELPLSAPIAAIPTYEEGGNYYMGNIVRLRLEALAGQVVLIGDEGSNRGRLLVDVASTIKPPTPEDKQKGRLYGSDALTYAFIAREDEVEPGILPILPDFFGELCVGKPPKPYWEFEHLRRIPTVRKIAHNIELLDTSARPTALIAVGDCFTAGAELAKRLGINGRYVGGLPVDETGVPDMSWAYVGDCEDHNVLILGAPDVPLETVIQAVSKNGSPHPYMLPAP